MRNFVYTPEDLLRALLVKEGITQGFWELGMDIQAKGISVSDKPSGPGAPGVVFRLQGLRLVERKEATPATVDASKLDSNHHEAN